MMVLRISLFQTKGVYYNHNTNYDGKIYVACSSIIQICIPTKTFAVFAKTHCKVDLLSLLDGSGVTYCARVYNPLCGPIYYDIISNVLCYAVQIKYTPRYHSLYPFHSEWFGDLLYHVFLC